MKRYFQLLIALCAVTPGATLDLNVATQSQLEALKGVGPAKARAIVEYRQKNGAFKRVDDLDKVKGIGKGMIDRFRSEVSVNTPVSNSIGRTMPKSGFTTHSVTAKQQKQ